MWMCVEQFRLCPMLDVCMRVTDGGCVLYFGDSELKGDVSLREINLIHFDFTITSCCGLILVLTFLLNGIHCYCCNFETCNLD